MKPLLTIELAKSVDERARQLLSAVPHLDVRQGRSTVMDTGSARFALRIVPLRAVTRPAAATAGPDQAREEHDEETTTLTLVISERLTASHREYLEQAGFSYVDATGATHLQGPGLLVHLTPTIRQPVGKVPSPSGIGVSAVRVIQTLLDPPGGPRTVTDLAAATGASLGQAHKVLTRLGAEGLTSRRREGRAVLHEVIDPSELLSWLARVPAAAKLPRRLKAFMYAPTPEAVLDRTATAAESTQLRWAATGSAAARLWGATGVVTAVPVTTIRISPERDLHQTAVSLGMEPVEEGHNVLLVADVGHLAVDASALHGGVHIAPKVRVWLDMLTEPRGQDAADLFRESLIGY